MRKILSGMAVGLVATAAMVTEPVDCIAQETYESAQLATQDLNGTAKYVGMGGAMEALGADISTITTNPAGIGLFRKSWAGISAGVTIQSASHDNGGQGNLGATLNNTGVTNVDLNQLGIVFSTKTNRNSWFNLAFNYSKNRNFNQITNAINSLNDASVNKMSYMRLASLQMDGTAQKNWANSINSDNRVDARWSYMSMLDDLNYSAVNDQYSQWYKDASGNKSYWADDYCAATAYCGQKKDWGYISNFDFNASGNINNRWFLGLTFGLKDVRYRSSNYYDETLQDTQGNGGDYMLTDERRITGTGFDVKFGLIVRPVEESGFRIGAYVHTPTWYNLNCSGNMSTASSLPAYKEKLSNGSYLISPTANGAYDSNLAYGNAYNYDYRYKIITPWKFGFSLGHTIENIVAIGATYEYADYSSIKNKINDGTVTDYRYYGDYWGGYGYSSTYDTYSKDNQMDKNTDNVLKGVHTLKLGVEVKPVPEVAIRMGYNWVSPMYKTDGSKDFTIDASPDYGSVGAYYSTYDYTNWKDTHRVTFGLGFKLSNSVNLDLAYQYSTQEGEYHPFQSLSGVRTYSVNADGSAQEFSTSPESNYGTPTTVKNNRHQINCTLGIRL